MTMHGDEQKARPPREDDSVNSALPTSLGLQGSELILNGMSALLYISDPATDEVLYVNRYMKEHFALQDRIAGCRCWELLQEDAVGRCPFCPIGHLMKNPDRPYIWEEKNSANGRWYKNTDSLIEWFDGRLVHLHYRVDITEIKNAEAELQERLTQQELMFALSQNFISTASMSVLIPNALRMVGEFMDVSKVVLMRENKATRTLDAAEFIWYSEKEGKNQTYYKPEQIALPLFPGTLTYDSFVAGRVPYLACSDVAHAENYAYAATHGIKSLLDVPIYVDGAYWGSLSFNECTFPREWSHSDIQLARHIGNIISGAISRHRMEEKLERMSSIVESSPQFVAYANAAGDVAYVNGSGLLAFGYTETELMEKGIGLLFENEVREKVLKEVVPQILAKGKQEFELPMMRKDGTRRIMSISAFRMNLGTNGIGMIASDITEKRQLEERLIWAMEQAEQSSKAKGEFLSRMSHEIRTPLNAVIGMTNIARASKEAERKEYCLEKIGEASVHLLGVINDILDMSKIEAKKFELAFTDFDFEKMLMRVVNVITFRADEKNQNLIVNLDDGLRHSIVSDEQRLAQVIANFLSNAVKFTSEGGTVVLNVRKLEEGSGLCTLQVEVSDTGIGMTPEQLGRLFQSFEQADGSISRQYGGTGLGLAISKSIVELMGGRIWAESVFGEGSTFAFSIKVQRGMDEISGDSQASAEWRTLRVLAVDDAPEVRSYFSEFAESVGFHCDTAADGEEACRILEADGNLFDIVFVDWRMPGMDGVALTRRIRKDFGDNIVVIMISAAMWSDIEAEARQAGVDRFLAKPLFRSQIVDCINECLGTAPARSDEVRLDPAEENFFAGHRILLVEDIEINREIVLALLEHTGLEIECAENGLAACKMYQDDPLRYELIFMDVHMPELDGYAATRRIRESGLPGSRDIPIIAMTADAFREDIERCLEAGMDDHVSKPVDIGEIMGKLRAVFS